MDKLNERSLARETCVPWDNSDFYEKLRQAVVKQAAKDYVELKRSDREFKSAKDFFEYRHPVSGDSHLQWYLCYSIDPDVLFDQIKKKRTAYWDEKLKDDDEREAFIEYLRKNPKEREALDDQERFI